MNWIYHSSQFKHECELEQQREDMQILSSMKTSDRQHDSSLLGSVRRRLIAPKFRNQHSTTPPPTTTIVISTSPNHSNESKSKTRSMTMDLKQNSPKESMTNNGKMISMFSLSRVDIHFENIVGYLVVLVESEFSNGKISQIRYGKFRWIIKVFDQCSVFFSLNNFLSVLVRIPNPEHHLHIH